MHFMIAAAALACVPSPKDEAESRMMHARNRWEAQRQACSAADRRGKLTETMLEELAELRGGYQAARREWEAEERTDRAPVNALEEEIRAACVELEILQATIAERGETPTRAKKREQLTRQIVKLIAARPAPAEDAEEHGIPAAPDLSVEAHAAPTQLRQALAELSRE